MVSLNSDLDPAVDIVLIRASLSGKGQRGYGTCQSFMDSRLYASRPLNGPSSAGNEATIESRKSRNSNANLILHNTLLIICPFQINLRQTSSALTLCRGAHFL